jgi:hypothetical protein
VESFLEEFDDWLTASVTVYILGGSAMTIAGLKDQTEDIDLALGVPTAFEHVVDTLCTEGFERVGEPTASFDGVGRTLELAHPDRGIQIDCFDRQIFGKVWLSETMQQRATEFWTGETVTAKLLADEDLFLLKAVAGGDLSSGRRRDIEDMRLYAQRGLDYDTILTEIETQRPFNEGATEATQIRSQSHPLFAIDVAIASLAGLPPSFTEEIERLGTEFEIEYTLMGAVADGVTDMDQLVSHVYSTVDAVAETDAAAVEAGISRLVDKQVLRREDGTVAERPGM